MSVTFVPGLRYETPAQELWALVIESYAGWEQRLDEAAAAIGLSPVSAWTLVQLDPDSPISQKELAARLHCNPSSVVDSTDRLEERGFVVRQPNPADRRVNILQVTPQGTSARDELIRRLFDPPAAFRRLPAGEQARLRDLLLGALTDAQPPTAG